MSDGRAEARSGVRAGRSEALATRLRDGRWHIGLVSALAVIAASLCLQPLLDGGWWFARTVAVVVVIAVTGGLSRSLHVPAPMQPLLQLGALLVALVLLFAGDAARWGVLPGPAAIGRLRELASQGRDYATVTQPPAGPDPGLLLLIVAGIGLTALVVDTLATALDLPGLTLLPLAALFLVPWAINDGTSPQWAFVVVALAWLAVLSALQRDRAGHWSPGAQPGSPGIGLGIAAATTALAVLSGGLITLRGPAEPVSIGAGQGEGTVRVDALVSLRRSLVSNDTRPVITFASTTDRPEYLRLSVLELFDGEQWRPIEPAETGPAPPPLPNGTIPSAEQPPSGTLAQYLLDVGPLVGTTLPSPSGTYQSLNDWPVVWDQRTSLPIRSDGGSIQGNRISLVASVPEADGATLRAASREPPDPAQVLPENLSDPAPLTGDELPRLAREITAGSQTPFDAAIALQRWFTTDGGFDYSTQIEGGSDEDALATFLEQRVGYCEQFAATMALMARSVGIPSRVVVGFTQGRLEDNQWIVRGVDAHAWPELWMGSAGWVRFEPTPGQPTATTPAYTAGLQPSSEPTAPTDQESAAPSQNDTDAPAQVPDETEAVAGSEQEGGDSLPLGWLALGGLLVLLLVPAVVRLVRRRRRLRIGDGESAYREVVDTLIDLRLGVESATPRSTLSVVSGLVESSGGSDHTPNQAEVAASLARILRSVEWHRYGTPGSASPATGPLAVGAQAGGGAPAGGVALAEPEPAAAAFPRPGALSADVRVARRALAVRAGWVPRMVAAVAPRSVLATPTSRGEGRGGPGSGPEVLPRSPSDGPGPGSP